MMDSLTNIFGDFTPQKRRLIADYKDNKNVCPLLNMQSAEECSDPTCLGQLCAWYIPPEHPKVQPEGSCAITYLADIAHEIRYT